jgi:hypothetical protein
MLWRAGVLDKRADLDLGDLVASPAGVILELMW